MDAYTAALSLDIAIFQAPMRQTLLDIAQDAAANGGANGIFDEHDLEAWVTLLTSYETEREVTGNDLADFSRYDLNGDGWTGGTGNSAV